MRCPSSGLKRRQDGNLFIVVMPVCVGTLAELTVLADDFARIRIIGPSMTRINNAPSNREPVQTKRAATNRTIKHSHAETMKSKKESSS